MFTGKLFSVGGTAFPRELIAAEGYRSTPDMQTDKNSYVDGYGDLHRSILPHTRSKVWIKTVEELTAEQKEQIQALMPSRTKVTARYWNDEKNTYKYADFYIPDIEFVIKHIDSSTNARTYKGFEVSLIAYGEDRDNA